MPKISQREARRLRKRVKELEQAIENQRSVWSQDWPGGTDIGRIGDQIGIDPRLLGAIETARKLSHAAVCTTTGAVVRFHALPLPKEK